MQYYQELVDLLLDNKLLLLFLVVAIGYYIGRIKVAGFSFGVAAVLFVGLAFGALDPGMALPDIVYTLGLVLFVYTIGLRSGASFFASFRKSGIRDNLLVIVVLSFSALLTILLGKLTGIQSTMMAGMFCGSLTNTPALASVIDILKNSQTEASAELLAEPVVGYSLAYPFGVIGVLLLFQLGMKFWKIDMKREQVRTTEVTGISTEDVIHVNVVVTNKAWNGRTWGEVCTLVGVHRVIASRRLPKGKKEVEIPSDSTLVELGDIFTIVGIPSVLEVLVEALGHVSERDLSLDRKSIDIRRIFVSNKRVIGKTIRELNLFNQYHAVVTRIRRGDVDMPIDENLRLEGGDRIRVIAPKENIKAISTFLGDSYQHLSEVDYISISIGISLGLLLGLLPFPLPGGGIFRLGFAAGPLLVALFLGKVGRSGKIIWVMSLNANLTLRQIGAVFFLAGIGLKAGYSFYHTLQTAGLQLILLGACVTLFTAGAAMLASRYIFKIPFNLMMGMIAALHTQPACLAFANEKDDTGAANIGYATVFPTAMILKIILAQLILGM